MLVTTFYKIKQPRAEKLGQTGTVNRMDCVYIYSQEHTIFDLHRAFFPPPNIVQSLPSFRIIIILRETFIIITLVPVS